MLREMDGTTVATPRAIPHDLPFLARLSRARGIYRATPPNYVDPEGDAELIRFHDRGLELAASVALRVGINRAIHGPKEDPGARWAPPFGAEEVVQAILGVIESSPCPPRMGIEHRWSPEARRYLADGSAFVERAVDGRPALPLGRASKLVVMLMWGLTPRFAPSGLEAALRARLHRSTGRLLPDEVFREAYGLACGDLYSALLCVTNVLTEHHWRPDRAALSLQSRLAYLRGDQKRVGDNFSAYYHFFGAALYGLRRPDWLATTGATVEAVLGSLFRGWDPQACWPNLLGAKVGAALRRYVSRAEIARASSGIPRLYVGGPPPLLQRADPNGIRLAPKGDDGAASNRSFRRRGDHERRG